MNEFKKRIARLSFAAALLMSINQGAAMSETIYVKPQGEYAKVETESTNQIIHDMLKGSKEQQKKAMTDVLQNSDKFAPPALCVLSSLLYAQDKPEEAAFWFYAGQLRSRADGTLCTDISARSGTDVLTQQFGPPVNRYMFQHVDKLKELVPKVVEWDRKTAHNYDRRWIALHGMGSFGFEEGKQKPIIVEKSEWANSDEKVRTKYLNDFNEAMTQLAQTGK